MVAINFPDSPTNGQEHLGYVWDATNNVWNRLPTLPALDLVNFSAVAPSNPQDGQFWFDTTAGKMYVYYNDGSSAQWVSTLGGLVGQTGTEGQQLIHNGTEWVAYDGKSRNLLYNGAMQVAQRGTSTANITAPGYYTADRWHVFFNDTTWTNTIEDDAPTGSGFDKSFKLEVTTANGSLANNSYSVLRQNIEGLDLQNLKHGTSDAEPLTLSFWVKSNVTGTYIVEWQNNDAGGSREISRSYTISSADTWEKKVLSIPGDTLGVIPNNSGMGLRVVWALAQGSDFTSGTLSTEWSLEAAANRYVGQTNVAASTGNYWQITGVQLETGTVATPFEHKSYSTELAQCQRYYYRQGEGQPNSAYAQARVHASSSAWCPIYLPTPMRTRPTSVEFSNLGLDYIGVEADDVTAAVIVADFSSNQTVIVQADTAGGMSVNQVRILSNRNNANGYLALDAEL